MWRRQNQSAALTELWEYPKVNWWANQKAAKKKEIAARIAEKTHSSKKEIIKSTMPYLPIIFKNKEMRSNIISELDLNDEEAEWLKQAK